MSSKFLTELSSDYEKLFETELVYDVIIYAGEEPNVKEIHAHSNILCIRSQYFRSAFSNEWAEKNDGKFILKKPNISSHLFNIILRFIYCGNIELKNLQGPEVLKLLIAVDELNIQQLVSYIQEYLIEHQTEFLNQNPTVPNMKPKTNVAPSRKLNLKFKLDSTLIKSKHIPLFTSWIDKKDSSYNKNKIPHEFKLLYCSSRDGFNGYNPLDWNGHSVWKKTADSFLFNFTDGKDISTAKLGYVNDTNNAIYCRNYCGPYTGDLFCRNSNNWTCYNSNYYPKIGIPEHFIVENYEVFQVIRQ
ncbi:BTB/POZ protein [Rhizophagus irregularis DAOM 181602=DAOM 197198]|nr:BTB/POZ protein [Rhizophagus irregularis DAOM 181602=DAOM 197198]